MNKSKLGGMGRFGLWVALGFMAMVGAIPGWAQSAMPSEADVLREELRVMKAEYEQRIRQMEERLNRLESSTAVAAAPAVETPEPADEKQVSAVVENFVDIHGYFRAGYGQNDQGSAQMGFKAVKIHSSKCIKGLHDNGNQHPLSSITIITLKRMNEISTKSKRRPKRVSVSNTIRCTLALNLALCIKAYQ